jgi:hypothetical protein
MPMLAYPTASAAANVEPDPANGSRSVPAPSGNTARTSLRRNSCGFNDGWGAIWRSALGVGLERITSPNGCSADGRRKPPVIHFRRLSCTRSSGGRRSITHGSHIERGITLTPANSRCAFLGRSPPRIVIVSRTMYPRSSNPLSTIADATICESNGLLAITILAPGTVARISSIPRREKNSCSFL